MSSRERIVAEIKKLGEKLGRAPSQAEFRREAKISWHQVYKHFRGMRAAVRAAGLEPGPRGGPLDERALVLDWARVVRELGRLPSRAEYDARGKHHSVTLHTRVGWHQMAHRFVLLVREFHLEQEWADVVEVVVKKYPLLQQMAISRWQSAKPVSAENALNRVIWPSGHRNIGNSRPGVDANWGMRLGRVVAAALAIEILIAAEAIAHHGDNHPNKAKAALLGTPDTETRRGATSAGLAYGEPLGLAAMAHAPTNEDGVLFLFGVVAADLGFRVERIQKEFPDVEAKREVAPGRWELQLWELELYSRNFKEHKHDPTKCHGIICWKHNWPDCPEGLEVIELSRVVKGQWP